MAELETARCQMPIILVDRKLRREDRKFKDSQSYIVKPCPKIKYKELGI